MDELIGFEFPVEGGQAVIVGPSASCPNYHECRVTTHDGAVFTSVRPTGLVREAAREAAWSSSGE